MPKKRVSDGIGEKQVPHGAPELSGRSISIRNDVQGKDQALMEKVGL